MDKFLKKTSIKTMDARKDMFMCMKNNWKVVTDYLV